MWEIKQRTLIDMAADRGAYICQSQSLNLFIAEPNIAKLSSMHFHGWKKGLKTGMYYLRTKPQAEAIQFTVDQVAQSDSKTATVGISSGFGSLAGAGRATAPGGSSPLKPTSDAGTTGAAAAAEERSIADLLARERCESADSSIISSSAFSEADTEGVPPPALAGTLSMASLTPVLEEGAVPAVEPKAAAEGATTGSAPAGSSPGSCEWEHKLLRA